MELLRIKIINGIVRLSGVNPEELKGSQSLRYLTDNP
jgi:hypothetical protein